MRTSDILFEDVCKENRKKWNLLKESLHSEKEKDSWILCLGAGVSISVGLPNWHKLLAMITAQLLPVTDVNPTSDFEDAYYRDIKSFYKKLCYENMFLDKYEKSLKGGYKNVFAGINVLESAEYIRNFFDVSLRDSAGDDKRDSRAFEKNVDYQINCLIQRACEMDMEIDEKNEKLKQTTLAAVARLMKSDHDALIHNVITYNYDNLLETYLRNICKCGDDKVRSIVKKDEMVNFDDKDNWNIHHIHGRIPIVSYPGEDMTESVVLTESDYYHEEQVNYSWTNILQSHAMLSKNLIFIGFSGADYNFRRIIKYTNKNEGSPHGRFIFLAIDDIVRAVFEDVAKTDAELKKCIANMNEEKSKYAFEKLFINHLIHAQTEYWKKNGLTVIWSSHEELFHDLESLH